VLNVPERIQKLKPYVAGKTIAEVKRLYNVNQISKLASNENRLGCSPRVRAAIDSAMEEVQDYPDPAARKLKTLIAEKNGVDVDEILVAAGSESILSILCRTFADQHSELVTADATFVGIFVQAGVMGMKVRRVPVTSGYTFDIEKMLDAIDEHTKMVYIANPNNPTGTYVDEKDYASFINRVPDDVLIIADEAYYEYAHHVPDYPSALDYRRQNVVVTRTFSKAYGLAGFRIGYAFADPELITQLSKCKLTFEPTALAQAAACAAIQDESFLEKSVTVVEEERAKLYRFFDEADAQFVKSIANSVMLIKKSKEAAATFVQKMLEHGVILRQLTAFGLPNCIRITIGTAAEMDHFKEVYRKIERT